MNSHPLRLLITGFSAYPGVPDNPTARLIAWLHAHDPSRQRPGMQLIAAVLPVDWAQTPAALEALLARHDPDATLHFGASRRATGFNIEQWARNRTSFHPDANGRRAQAAAIIAGGPRALRAPLPAARLALRLRAMGLPCVASADAGQYLCNATYFVALDRARRLGRPLLSQFAHVPATLAADERQAGRLSWSGLQRGALALIEELAAAARREARLAAGKPAVHSGAIHSQP